MRAEFELPRVVLFAPSTFPSMHDLQPVATNHHRESLGGEPCRHTSTRINLALDRPLP